GELRPLFGIARRREARRKLEEQHLPRKIVGKLEAVEARRGFDGSREVLHERLFGSRRKRFGLIRDEGFMNPGSSRLRDREFAQVDVDSFEKAGGFFHRRLPGGHRSICRLAFVSFSLGRERDAGGRVERGFIASERREQEREREDGSAHGREPTPK